MCGLLSDQEEEYEDSHGDVLNRSQYEDSVRRAYKNNI